MSLSQGADARLDFASAGSSLVYPPRRRRPAARSAAAQPIGTASRVLRVLSPAFGEDVEDLLVGLAFPWTDLGEEPGGGHLGTGAAVRAYRAWLRGGKK